MANKDDVNQANQGAPAADIPDLKKKEKERKKAGAGWGGAKPGGGAFSGATGGTVARAAASAAGATGGAAAEAAGAGWLSSMLASLTATVLGKAILAAGVAMFLIGAGVFGYALLKGGAGAPGGIAGDLGALSSSMKVRAGGGDRTGYVASNGEIMFDPLKKAEAKKAEAEKTEKAPEDKTAGEAVPPADAGTGKGDWNRPGLDHNMSGTKLSSSLGGGFGGKNIFSGNSSAPKLNEALAKVSIKGGEKGRISSSAKGKTGRTVAGGKAKSMKANKAFGQLKVAKGMSALGAGTATGEGARSTASSAFDGQTGTGNVEGGPTAPAGAVTSPSGSGGAPDMTAPNVDTPIGVAGDPNGAAAIAGIAALAKAAGDLKKQAEMMMMMGLALIAVGIAIMCTGWPWCIAIGIAIVAIGAMLVGISMKMKAQAEMMKGMADQMSQQLAARTGDANQNATNQYCIGQAYNGTDPANCNPPDSVTNGTQSDNVQTLGVQQHRRMVNETGRVEGLNGSPTP